MIVNAVNATTQQHEADYQELLLAVRKQFDTESLTRPIFTTTMSPETLFSIYMNSLPVENRKHHDCRACEDFLTRFGGLVYIDSAGRAVPVMWPCNYEAFGIYGSAIKAMRVGLTHADVTGVFLHHESTWGKPLTKEWTHFAVDRPTTNSAEFCLKVMAEKKEDFRILDDALGEFALSTITQVVALLETDSLYRSEKCLGHAKFLAGLKVSIESTKNFRIQDNLIWRAVATAPAGFCHPRSSMIGTLLGDIAAGLGFEEVSRRFAAKMHPLQYQRPQAAPSAGNIAQAEKVFAEMGLAPSLRRRFAKLEEVEAIWRPVISAPKDADGGVFAHLKAKNAEMPTRLMDLPPQVITWTRFHDTVLPTATSIQFLVPSMHGNYAAILTAADPNSPPLFQWDSPAKRNPFSSYIYNGGSLPGNWGLQGSTKVPVTAITRSPAEWAGNDIPHHGKAIILVLEGARDLRYERSGIALFPETLRAELREVRSVIEAYSKSAVTEGYSEASACGVCMTKASGGIRLQVTTPHGNIIYTLDRWE